MISSGTAVEVTTKLGGLLSIISFDASNKPHKVLTLEVDHFSGSYSSVAQWEADGTHTEFYMRPGDMIMFTPRKTSEQSKSRR